MHSYVATALSGIAFAAEPSAADRPARLCGAVARLNGDAGVVANAYSERADELEHLFEGELALALGEEAWEQLKKIGSAMRLEEAITLAQSLCEATASV
jgi:hypothetical protein